MAYKRRSRNKDINRVVSFALRNGFESVKTAGGHLKLKLGNVSVTLASSPSCPYAYEHALKDIKKILKEHNERSN
jgi:hypothetical protein